MAWPYRGNKYHVSVDITIDEEIEEFSAEVEYEGESVHVLNEHINDVAEGGKCEESFFYDEYYVLRFHFSSAAAVRGFKEKVEGWYEVKVAKAGASSSLPADTKTLGPNR